LRKKTKKDEEENSSGEKNILFPLLCFFVREMKEAIAIWIVWHIRKKRILEFF